MNIVLTPEEVRNGWTTEALEKYRASRELAAEFVPGNIVTEYQKPEPPVACEGVRAFNPHRWGMK